METVFNIPGVRGGGSPDRRHGGGGQQTSVVLNCTLGMFWPSSGQSFSATFSETYSTRKVGRICFPANGIRTKNQGPLKPHPFL